jgi:hypothetical protein
MEEADAERAIRGLVVELRQARDTLEEAQRSVVGLKKLIDGYVELFPLLESVVVEEGGIEDDDGHPRGMDAALQVLGTNTGNWLSVLAVVQRMEGLGWLPTSTNPANAIRTALERLVSAELVEKGKTASGTVVYRKPVPPSSPGGYDDFGEEPF